MPKSTKIIRVDTYGRLVEPVEADIDLKRTKQPLDLLSVSREGSYQNFVYARKFQTE